MVSNTKQKIKVTITIPEELSTKMKILAIQEKTTFSSLAEIAINKFLEERNKS